MSSTRNYLSIEKLQKKRDIATKRKIINTTTITLPPYGSLKDKVQEVYDQGNEGSCTANAFCGAYRILECDKSFNPSRQYVYWNERMIENGFNPMKITDSGADVQDAVVWVSKYGVCSETSWPYDITKVDVEPPIACYIEAANHKLGELSTIVVGDNDSIKQSLLNGVPVLLAIGVYQSFESTETAKTGNVALPKCQNYGDQNDPIDPFLGGHEILIVGYYDKTSTFTVLNSWGSSWGASGFCYIPYAYISNPNLTFELCCLSKADDNVNENTSKNIEDTVQTSDAVATTTDVQDVQDVQGVLDVQDIQVVSTLSVDVDDKKLTKRHRSKNKSKSKSNSTNSKKHDEIEDNKKTHKRRVRRSKV